MAMTSSSSTADQSSGIRRSAARRLEGIEQGGDGVLAGNPTLEGHETGDEVHPGAPNRAISTHPSPTQVAENRVMASISCSEWRIFNPLPGQDNILHEAPPAPESVRKRDSPDALLNRLLSNAISLRRLTLPGAPGRLFP